MPRKLPPLRPYRVNSENIGDACEAATFACCYYRLFLKSETMISAVRMRGLAARMLPQASESKERVKEQGLLPITSSDILRKV